MRALIISDIHANLEALDAVLDDARAHGGYNAVWCLGDLVGYGADPGPCLARLRTLPIAHSDSDGNSDDDGNSNSNGNSDDDGNGNSDDDGNSSGGSIAIAGNHDHAATGQLNPDLFNHAARAAALWTTQQLTAADLDYLAGLPLTAHADNFTMAHGSLRDPILEYLISAPAAAATFALLKTPFCLVGHSHYPLVWSEDGANDADGGGRPAVALLDPAQPLRLDTGRRLIINPGSVGQPRDGDWRASYLLFDDADSAANADGRNSNAGVIYHRRVEYDIAAAQAKIRNAGLPEVLAARLAEGR